MPDINTVIDPLDISGRGANEATRDAAESQRQGTEYAADVTRQMYDRQVDLQNPFLQTGYTGNSMLAALLTGQPVNYTDPNYKEVTDKTLLARKNLEALQQNPSLAGADFWKDVNNGEDPLQRLMRDTSLNNSLPYSSDKKWYAAPDGTITDTPQQRTFDPSKDGAGYQLPGQGDIPKLANLPDYGSTVTADYASMVPDIEMPSYDEMVTNAKVEDSPAYRWRLQEAQKNANRSLASRGLSGGGQAVTTLSNLASGIGADEYDKQFSRNQSRYSAALNAALTKYGQNTDKYNATRGAQQQLYAANTDKANNLYNSDINAYNQRLNLANTNYGRLTDTIKAGQGAAGTIGNASGSYGNSASNIAMTGANNQANSILAGAQAQQASGSKALQLGGTLASLFLA